MSDNEAREAAEPRMDDDGTHLYWFDPVEGCWVAFKRVDCVGEEELPARRIPVAAKAEPQAIDRDKLIGALTNILSNASNYPFAVQMLILGQDMGPCSR